MNKKLLFWIVFWPGFLTSLLLNGIRTYYGLHYDWPLILGFGAYVAVCPLGLALAIRKLK